LPLPLDTFRAVLGLPPWHFWQFADSTIVPIQSKCSTLTYEYDWQGSDAAGRESVRTAIADAEWKMLDYLGYRVAPEYVTDAVVDWPRYYEASLNRGSDWDATYRRIAVAAPEGYVNALGVEQLTLIGSATVAGGTLVYSALFNAGLQDTFTITLPTSVTDPDQIAVYFSTADRFDDTTVGQRWRVEPVNVAISGGNVVIKGRKWLVGKPILYQNPVAAVLNPQTAGNFVTSLDVYQRTTNENGNSIDTCQSALIYETNDCGACWGRCCCQTGTTSSDPGTVGMVIARAGIRDKELGLVTPAAAVYDSSAGTWSSQWCCGVGYCDPDRVKLRYNAGIPLVNGQIAPRFRDPLVWLAAAELKRRVCTCREQNEKLHDLQQDLTLQATQSERYAPAPEDLSNPFGTRRGHVQAWRSVKYDILRRGISA
jgi:hypothetical protein